MVHKQNNEETQDDVEITHDTTDTTEPELEDIEANQTHKIKTLQTKLKAAEEKARTTHEEMQRIKADFLNAKRRLEEERLRDKERITIKHIEKLLPIYDSFYLATLDKDTWAKADEKWRQGMEGVYSQIKNLFESYQVTAFDPSGNTFDPSKHEALSMIPVQEENKHNQVITVIQLGFEIKHGDKTELIRPARVTVGEKEA